MPKSAPHPPASQCSPRPTRDRLPTYPESQFRHRILLMALQGKGPGGMGQRQAHLLARNRRASGHISHPFSHSHAAPITPGLEAASCRPEGKAHRP